MLNTSVQTEGEAVMHSIGGADSYTAITALMLQCIAASLLYQTSNGLFVGKLLGKGKKS